MQPVETRHGEGTSGFRLDVPLHDILTQPGSRTTVPPASQPQKLPDPVFPQYPELLGDDGLGPPMPPPKRHYKTDHITRAFRGWTAPWLKSRLLPGDFHPIIAYLFTEWKCNLDCHYCWAFDNRVKGMTEEIAKRSIDWLRDTGGGVLALMGGEPLLRPQFAHKVCYYAAKNGFWIYVPTNARLPRPQVTDWLADTGVATFNFAVDAVDEKRGLPKALAPIQSYFNYLIKKQYQYGYSVFFNVNICRNNMDDVRQLLTEIARDSERQANLHGCTAIRRYVLENPDHHKRAEMLVRMICREDGSRQFEVVSEDGWGGARKHVFPRLLEAEVEAARPDLRERSRITPENYSFEMAGTECVRGRLAYVIAIEPKTPNKYLARGRIFVDANEYAIIRVEGKPAKNPSFWVKSVHFVHDYDKSGSFWFPVSDRSVTDVRIFGATEMTIEYFDYAPNTSPLSASGTPGLRSFP